MADGAHDGPRRSDSQPAGGTGAAPPAAGPPPRGLRRMLTLAWWRTLVEGLDTATKVLLSVTGLVVAAVGLGAALGIGGGGDVPRPDPHESSDEPSSATPVPLFADFDLDIEVDPDEVAAGPWEPYFYWLPGDLRQLDDPPQRCNDRRRWAYESGGADADVVWAKLVLENGSAAEVSVDDVRVEVISDVPTTGGTVAACPLGGASVDTYGLIVDLTASPPRLSFKEDPGSQQEPVPRFELAPGEQDAFLIRAFAPEDRLVTWRLLADVRQAGRTRTLTLPSEGGLRLAGTGDLAYFTWEQDHWQRYRF